MERYILLNYYVMLLVSAGVPIDLVGAPAWQSSQYTSFFADQAVDGNASPDYHASTCSMTYPDGDPFPWWAVDMINVTTVVSVTIVNIDISSESL